MSLKNTTEKLTAVIQTISSPVLNEVNITSKLLQAKIVDVPKIFQKRQTNI